MRQCNKSDVKSIKCGVPQGFVLCSLSYCVYMNTLFMFHNIFALYVHVDIKNMFFFYRVESFKSWSKNNAKFKVVSESLKSNKLGIHTDNIHYMMFY